MTFQFTLNAQTFFVHTEVGDGLTRVVLEEEAQEEAPISFEASEE
jgi:hypothetical protein